MQPGENRQGSRVAGYVICVVLALLAAVFVLALSTWTTLLVGAVLMVGVVLVLAALRNRR
jgi:hypothetical protein